jgi:hypothetical protein
MMSPPIAQSSWNMTLPNTELKAFVTSRWKTTQPRWRSKMHLMPWIIISHPPLDAIPNWCGENCVTKTSRNWKHKMRLVNQYSTSLVAMGWIPLEGLVMVKKHFAQRKFVIQYGMWPFAIWKKSWNLCGNPLMKSYGWKEFWKCLKTIPERPLVDKFGMHWNVSLKESNETSRSWSNL